MYYYKFLFILFCNFMVHLLIFNKSIFSANFYVNDNSITGDRYCTAIGNDLNNGTSPNTPTRTITNIINKSNLGPGDIVYVDTGIYNETVVITSNDQGNSSSGYVTLKGVARNGTNSIINGSYSTAWNHGCITLDNVKYVKIDSFYLKYNGSSEIRGIYSKNYCTNIMIINSIIISNQLSGIKMERTYFSIISNNICQNNNQINWTWPSGILLGHHAYSNTIISNRCIKNGTGTSGNGNGIRVEEGSLYNLIKGNDCSSNYNKGIDFNDESAGNENRYNNIINNILSYNWNDGISGEGYPGTDDNSILNNICHHNGGDGIALYWNGDSSDDNTLISNICYSNHGRGIHIDGNNNFLSYNLCYSNGSHGMEIKGEGSNTNIFSVIYMNQGDGIRMTSDVSISLLRNCILFKNDNDGFVFQSGTGGVEVRNCISLSNKEYGYNREGGSSVTLKYSDAYGNINNDYSGVSIGDGCITNNPIFLSVTPGMMNFLFLSNISPCVDTGDPDDSVPPGGNKCIDMGRYEYIYTNTAYYINDSSINGDIFCISIGSDSNPGTTPALPKASITNLLKTYSIKPGNFIYIDTGKYMDKITLTTNDDGSVEDPMILLGAGKTKTMISNDQTIPNMLYVKGEDHITRIKGVKIMNLRFIGGDESVKIEKSHHCIIADCQISDYKTSGIVLWSTNDNIIITNNYIKGNGLTRSSIFIGDGSNTNKIINNIAVNNNDAGIYLANWEAPSKNNHVSFNNVSSNSNGILVLVPGNTIKSNEIFNCSQSGIKFDGNGRTNRVLGNDIHHVYGDNEDKSGILVFKEYNSISNNNIYYCSNAIIIKWDGILNSIGNNEIHDCKNSIILYSEGGTCYNYVKKNIIYSIKNEGINVLSSHNEIISNTIYGVGNGIKLDIKGRTNIIAGNNIYNAYIGIQLYREYNNITNNRIHNLNLGIVLEYNSHYNYIARNELYNNTLDGIIRGSGGTGSLYNTFLSNRIYHNGTQGISFCNGTNNYNRFIGNTIWGNQGEEAGIRIDGKNNLLLYNSCYSNNGNGIMINGYNGSVTNKDNRCYHNRTNGMYLYQVNGGIVMNNNLSSNKKNGIHFIDSDNLLIKKNILKSNENGILFLNDSDNNMVLKNLIYRNRGKGIGFQDNNCNNNSIINNVLYKNQNYGIDIDNISDTVIKNVITMSNLKGINKAGSLQIITYCCTNDGGNNISDGAGCISVNPLFNSLTEGSEDFRLKWNSPCIGTGEPNPLTGCMGLYPQYHTIDIPVILTKSRHTVVFSTSFSNGSIPYNGKIDIYFPNGFNLNNASFYTTTSSWGGNPGTFSSIVNGQVITVTRSGGNDSVSGKSENLIFTNIINPSLPGNNYKILIITKDDSDNIIETIDGNYFSIVSNTIITLSKSISNIKLNGFEDNSIPGATIEYCIDTINNGSYPAWNIVIYDRIFQYVIYKTNSISSINGWIAEFSTNSDPDQCYYSSDYTNEEPSSSKIRWIRWKTEYMESSEKKRLVYQVTIK